MQKVSALGGNVLGLYGYVIEGYGKRKVFAGCVVYIHFYLLLVYMEVPDSIIRFAADYNDRVSPGELPFRFRRHLSVLSMQPGVYYQQVNCQ